MSIQNSKYFSAALIPLSVELMMEATIRAITVANLQLSLISAKSNQSFPGDRQCESASVPFQKRLELIADWSTHPSMLFVPSNPSKALYFRSFTNSDSPPHRLPTNTTPSQEELTEGFTKWNDIGLDDTIGLNHRHLGPAEGRNSCTINSPIQFSVNC